MIKNRKIDKLVVGNLAVKRDFGYAPKYVEAMWMMMQLDRADDFIICSGVSIKLRDIVEYVFDNIGINKKLIFEDNKLFRPNEISDIYGNNLKAKNVLKWEYNHSFFDILDLLIEEEMMENNEK